MPASRYLAAAGLPLSFVAVALVGGGQEEFGWRGLLQPALQERWTPLGAAVTVAVVLAITYGGQLGRLQQDATPIEQI